MYLCPVSISADGMGCIQFLSVNVITSKTNLCSAELHNPVMNFDILESV